MKEKIIVILSSIAFILFLGILVYNLEYKKITYYTQIDNNKIKELTTTDSMKYEYELTAYDEEGKSKKITFKTTRELKDKAYLKIKYMYISGVNSWEEVNYYNLPNKVQIKYKN